MATPVLFRLSMEAQAPRPASPSPMHLNVTEKVDACVERLLKDYSSEQNATYLRELKNSEPVRERLYQRYRELGQLKEALDIAVDTVDLVTRKERLDPMIDGLVKQDAFEHLNRLVAAVQFERRDATKYKIGLAYAEGRNYIRAFEVYFFIERLEWRNRYFLSVMKHIPDAEKTEFFRLILLNLVDSKQIAGAISAVRTYPRVNAELTYIAVVKHMLEKHDFENIALVLNELPPQLRYDCLVTYIPHFLSNGLTEYALKLVEPLKLNSKDEKFYYDFVFCMGVHLININRLEFLNLILNSVGPRKNEFEALIPKQPMHD